MSRSKASIALLKTALQEKRLASQYLFVILGVTLAYARVLFVGLHCNVPISIVRGTHTLAAKCESSIIIRARVPFVQHQGSRKAIGLCV